MFGSDGAMIKKGQKNEKVDLNAACSAYAFLLCFR